MLENPLVAWLAASPAAGTVAPAGSQQADITLDSTGLALGDYITTLDITSNDPDEALAQVPVTMHVSNGQAVAVSSLGAVLDGDAAAGAAPAVLDVYDSVTLGDLPQVLIGSYQASLRYVVAVDVIETVSYDPACANLGELKQAQVANVPILDNTGGGIVNFEDVTLGPVANPETFVFSADGPSGIVTLSCTFAGLKTSQELAYKGGAPGAPMEVLEVRLNPPSIQGPLPSITWQASRNSTAPPSEEPPGL